MRLPTAAARLAAASVRPAALVLAAAALLVHAVPALAQDAFGTSVALTGPDEVVALKPGAARGPSEAVVFRRDTEGRWGRAADLSLLPGGYPGETLTPPLAAGGDLLLLGGGDPDGAVAGHLYRREGQRWTPAGRVPVRPGAGLPTPSETLTMPTLMRLMGPPARQGALSPDGSLLAVAGGAVEPGTVHLLRRAGTGWTLEAVLRSEDRARSGGQGDGVEADRPAVGARPDATGFGAALAVAQGRVVVGAPEAEPGGAVHLFELRDGSWVRAALLLADSTEADGRLGAALALAAGEILAAAPEHDRVVRFAPDGPGKAAGDARGGAERWTRVGELLRPEEGLDAFRFGHSLAASDRRLLVGAPLTDQGRGAVHSFVREADGWREEAVLTPGELESGDAFGFAVALRDDRAVVGAPGADGGHGRAAVVELADREAATWLEAGAELAGVTGVEPVRCQDGRAAGFDCDGVDLLSFVPLSALGAGPGERVSDLWGWTDPETEREYVIVGRTAGFAFVDVTEPGAPRYLGYLPANPSGARDIKVYRDHAFMTGDGAGDHGLLVFDLTRLREVAEVPTAFTPDARYDRVASAHNLVLDTESGFAYTVGTNTGGQSCGGGLHMIDVRTPTQPAFAGCYTDTEGLIWAGRSHDAQCTVYRGPDEAYQGRQICFASNETALRIVDVTDKENPVPVAAVSHPGTAYIHQGWLTEDHRYLYVNDELDEIVGTTDRTRTLIWDVAELDDPILVAEHLGPDRATDHNLYIRGDRAYLANYQAGFRVLDVSDPERPVEVGWFDTTPYGENPPGFLGGAWTAFPFFRSGTVAVSSQSEGLFLLRPRPAVLP